MNKKQVISLSIFIFCIIASIACSLFYFTSHTRSSKASSTVAATTFLKNYYTGEYTVNEGDTSKNTSKTTADISVDPSLVNETPTEQGITTGNLIVSKRLSALFTQKGLSDMLSKREFTLVAGNTKDSLKDLSVKQTDSTNTQTDFDFVAQVNMQDKDITINGQLSLVFENGSYKIDRFYSE